MELMGEIIEVILFLQLHLENTGQVVATKFNSSHLMAQDKWPTTFSTTRSLSLRLISFPFTWDGSSPCSLAPLASPWVHGPQGLARGRKGKLPRSDLLPCGQTRWSTSENASHEHIHLCCYCHPPLFFSIKPANLFITVNLSLNFSRISKRFFSRNFRFLFCSLLLVFSSYLSLSF